MTTPEVEKQLENIKTYFTKMPGMHKNWSSKRQAFYSFFEDVLTNSSSITTLLNIGVGPNKESKKWNKHLSNFLPSIERFDNLEIEEKYANKYRGEKFLENITVGDVRKIDEAFAPNSFDMIFWNQGPEHIYREEWEETFNKLFTVSKRVVFMHCPWGKGYDGDKWHYAKSIRKGEFESFGFKELTHGVEDTRDGGIIAYKIL